MYLQVYIPGCPSFTDSDVNKKVVAAILEMNR